jgi:hypothetical protein
MKEAYERERKFFLNNALWNEAIWGKRETREVLRDLCWNGKEDPDPMDYSDIYRERHTEFSTEHPEWFGDELRLKRTAAPLIPDPIESILVRQIDLQKQITGLNSKLAAVFWIAILFVMLLRLERRPKLQAG